jgi:hypothetical protein
VRSNVATGRTEKEKRPANARKVSIMRITTLIGSLVLLASLATFPAPIPASPTSQFGVAVSVRFGPPLLPVYAQPLCPGPGYIWIPGYWAYDDDDGYYWVPGTWAFPPEVGLLWTPGYWAFSDGFYVWNAGYWGPVVGFYGGINYGFGYPGTGFYGGYWRGGQYYYNRSVTNINTTIVRNVYNTRVVNNNTTTSRVSFNGGSGGVHARPAAAEMTAARQHHVAMTSAQVQHQQAARADRGLFASVNHGRPDVAATARPGDFNGRNTAPKSMPGNPNRPTPSRAPEARPTPARPHRPPASQPRTAPESRPIPSRPNNTPSHVPAPTSKPAPSHPDRPTHQPTRESAPVPSHPDRPAHQPAPRPSPAPSHQPAPRPSHVPQPSHQPTPKPAPAPSQHKPQQH